MNRFYPDHLPVVPNEACWDDFCVLDVDGKRGQGVLALRDFSQGSVLFRMNGTLTTEMTLHSLQMAPGLHLDDPYIAGKVLHSCEPNSWLDVETRIFFATRDIAAGELLTMDYDETEDVLFRAFQCCCGSPSCRGTVGGKLVKKVAPRRRRQKTQVVVTASELPAQLYAAVMAERQNYVAADYSVASAI
jgi:uncharacterized protein